MQLQGKNRLLSNDRQAFSCNSHIYFTFTVSALPLDRVHDFLGCSSEEQSSKGADGLAVITARVEKKVERRQCGDKWRGGGDGARGEMGDKAEEGQKIDDI